MLDPNVALDDVNIDERGIREQGTHPLTVAERLVSETLFEVEGWKKIQAIPLAFQSFGFDPDSVSLKFEEVELPISIGNKHFNKHFKTSFETFETHQTLSSTYLVSFHMTIMINTLYQQYVTYYIYYYRTP